MSKRNGKRYNPHKRVPQLSEFLMRDKAIAMLVTMDSLVFYNWKRRTLHLPDAALAAALRNYRYKWAVECAVLCRQQDGTEYLVTQRMACQEPCRHEDLIPLIDKVHRQLIDECNPMHVLNFGWLTTLREEDIPMEAQEWVYRQLDGFECLTKLEADKLPK